jgi:hypothetical protein
MASTQPRKESQWLTFLNSGLSGMGATCVVQPIDLIKTRMQLSGVGGAIKYKSSFHAAADIVKTEGLRALYNGYVIGLILIARRKETNSLTEKSPTFILNIV